jgi:hypothetical protein
VSAYELASRLSYFIRGTMPDAALFEAAENGSLVEPEVLSAHTARLLAEGDGARFVEGYAGQWFEFDRIANREVNLERSPAFSEPLRAEMLAELEHFFAEFVLSDRPYQELLTRDVNFVGPALSAHYGFSETSEPLVRVEVTDDARIGLLGLAGMQMLPAYGSASDVIYRGSYVLGKVLCDPPPPPPPDLDFPFGEDEPADPSNSRAVIEDFVREPRCQTCHDAMHDIGFSMENFDTIGQYRTTYASGAPIDPAVTFGDGTALNGLADLAQALSVDPRLLSCAVDSLHQFAHGRRSEDPDEPWLETIRQRWQLSCSPSLSNAVQLQVLAEPFRNRAVQGAAR